MVRNNTLNSLFELVRPVVPIVLGAVKNSTNRAEPVATSQPEKLKNKSQIKSQIAAIHGKAEAQQDYTYGDSNCNWKFFNSNFGIPDSWLKFAKETFMPTTDDKHWTRQFAAYNEIAEAGRKFCERHLKPLSKLFYFGFWGLNLSYFGVRNTSHALENHSATEGIKKVVHDALAAVGLPVAVVRTLQYGISKFYESMGWEGKLVPDLVESVVSFVAAKKSITGLFDPAIEWLMHNYGGPFIDNFKPMIDGAIHPMLGNLAKTFFGGGVSSHAGEHEADATDSLEEEAKESGLVTA